LNLFPDPGVDEVDSQKSGNVMSLKKNQQKRAKEKKINKSGIVHFLALWITAQKRVKMSTIPRPELI